MRARPMRGDTYCCKNCDDWKHFTEFYPKNKKKDGGYYYDSLCKVCRRHGVSPKMGSMALTNAKPIIKMMLTNNWKELKL